MDFISKIGDKVLGIVSLGVEPKTAGIITIVAALVIVLLIVVAIVSISRHKRHNKHRDELSSTAKINVLNKEDLAPAPVPVVEEAPTQAPVVEAWEQEYKPEEEPAIEQVESVEQAVEEAVQTEAVDEQSATPLEVEEKPEEVKEEIEEVEEEIEEVEEEPVAEEVVAKKAPAKKSLPGKWIVELKSVGEFMSKLVASNGEVMLSSEIYSSEEGARTGIATIIKWVEEGSFVIYQDKKKNYYYKLKTAGNRLICVGEIYKSKEQCENAVESVKRIAKTAIINEELIEGARYVDYRPIPFEQMTKGPQGKWKVEITEDGRFSARLYASNGQLMMATEEVASRKTALNGIESVKKNSIEGNFIVDRDKFGRYYYKLRNSQKSVICIGETYDSLSACTKALESVRRFAINAVVIPE